MPEGVGYGPQFTASVGQSINYVGRDVYGYSGAVTSTDSQTPITMLKYTTGSRTQSCIFQFFDVLITDKERIFKITLNGNAIIQNNYDGSDPSFPYNGKFHVLVPPYTEVEALANINGANANMFVTMKGKLSK